MKRDDLSLSTDSDAPPRKRPDRPRIRPSGFLDFQASFPELCETSAEMNTRAAAAAASSGGGATSPASCGTGGLGGGTPSSGGSGSVGGKLSLTSLSQPCLSASSHGPTKILPFVYLGSQQDAMDADLLKKHGIHYVLNLSITCPKPSFLQEEHFKRIPVNDSYTEKLRPHFETAFEFLDKVGQANSCVLIHCLAGISRSPTLAIAYVMRRLHLTSEEAYRYVKEKRPSISPNFNFLGQLLEYENDMKRRRVSHGGSVTASPLTEERRSPLSSQSPNQPSSGVYSGPGSGGTGASGGGLHPQTPDMLNRSLSCPATKIARSSCHTPEPKPSASPNAGAPGAGSHPTGSAGHMDRPEMVDLSRSSLAFSGFASSAAAKKSAMKLDLLNSGSLGSLSAMTSSGGSGKFRTRNPGDVGGAFGSTPSSGISSPMNEKLLTTSASGIEVFEESPGGDGLTPLPDPFNRPASAANSVGGGGLAPRPFTFFDRRSGNIGLSAASALADKNNLPSPSTEFAAKLTFDGASSPSTNAPPTPFGGGPPGTHQSSQGKQTVLPMDFAVPEDDVTPVRKAPSLIPPQTAPAPPASFVSHYASNPFFPPATCAPSCSGALPFPEVRSRRSVGPPAAGPIPPTSRSATHHHGFGGIASAAVTTSMTSSGVFSDDDSCSMTSSLIPPPPPVVLHPPTPAHHSAATSGGDDAAPGRLSPTGSSGSARTNYDSLSSSSASAKGGATATAGSPTTSIAASRDSGICLSPFLRKDSLTGSDALPSPSAMEFTISSSSATTPSMSCGGSLQSSPLAPLPVTDPTGFLVTAENPMWTLAAPPISHRMSPSVTASSAAAARNIKRKQQVASRDGSQSARERLESDSTGTDFLTEHRSPTLKSRALSSTTAEDEQPAASDANTSTPRGPTLVVHSPSVTSPNKRASWPDVVMEIAAAVDLPAGATPRSAGIISGSLETSVGGTDHQGKNIIKLLSPDASRFRTGGVLSGASARHSLSPAHHPRLLQPVPHSHSAHTFAIREVGGTVTVIPKSASLDVLLFATATAGGGTGEGEDSELDSPESGYGDCHHHPGAGAGRSSPSVGPHGPPPHHPYSDPDRDSFGSTSSLEIKVS